MADKKSTEKTENPHKNHRKRLKAKFMDYGDEALAEHEFVELMLCYGIPQGNVNGLAHELYNDYRSFANILEASNESLLAHKGISEHTLSLIKFILAASRKYVNDKNNIDKKRLTPFNIELYIKNLFYGHVNEIAYVMLLDDDLAVQKIKKLSTGTETRAAIEIRDIIRFAVNEHYPYVLLAHNHPNGSKVPSMADVETTKNVREALNFINVNLVDHLIVAGDSVTSILKYIEIQEKNERP